MMHDSPAELAHSVVRARTVEIEVPLEERDVAVRAIRAAGVGDVSAGPDGLTLRVERREEIPMAVAALAEAAVAIYRVAEREPDLEAAPFALHGQNPNGGTVQ